MNPWSTDAIGTQNVVFPSSVCHADFATLEKFVMPVRLFSEARKPCWYSLRDSSNGRHVTRSPAVPPLRRAESAALYSVGAVGANWTLMSGCAFSNAGMILLFQIDASSLRQLSIVIVVVFVCALAAATRTLTTTSPRATSSAASLRPVLMLPPLCRTNEPTTSPEVVAEGVLRDLPRHRAGPRRPDALRRQTERPGWTR